MRSNPGDMRLRWLALCPLVAMTFIGLAPSAQAADVADTADPANTVEVVHLQRVAD